MRIIRAADCRRMAWKNGGGETTEIASHPEGAGLDDFAWRLSAARVVGDGPFSIFPGVDRTVVVLSGEGLELRRTGVTHRLGLGDDPFPFPADEPTAAHLLGGAVEDLNIMTRRMAARHHMRRVLVRGSLRLGIGGTAVLLFCAAGPIGLNEATLQARDTAVFDDSGRCEIGVEGQGALYVIEVERTSV